MSGGLAQQEALFSAPGVYDLSQSSEQVFNDPHFTGGETEAEGGNDLSKVTEPYRTEQPSPRSLIL